MRTSSLRQLSLSFALCALASCSFVERNTIGLFSADAMQNSEGFTSPAAQAPASEQTAMVAVEPRSAKAPANVALGTRIEVIWQIPKDPVDGFIVRYGYTTDAMKFEQRVTTGELDRYEDPKFGFVYRYVLKDIPVEKPVFVSLMAFTGSEQSTPSPVFEVAPTPIKK